MTIVRKFQAQDLTALVELFESYRAFYKMHPNKGASKIFLAERTQNKDSIIFVSINEQHKLTGFVQLYPIFSSTRLQRLWLLNDLFVDEKHRGKGVSKLLIIEAQKMCKESNACGMILETAKKNEIGNTLYALMGFKKDEDHNYYEWSDN